MATREMKSDMSYEGLGQSGSGDGDDVSLELTLG